MLARFKKHEILLRKIVVVGILLHFFVFTIVTRKIGLHQSFMNIVWLRKELMIIGFVVVLTSQLRAKKSLFSVLRDRRFLAFVTGRMVALIVAAITSLGIHHQSIGQLLLAFKYDFLGFAVATIFVFFGYQTTFERLNAFMQFFKKLLLRALIVSLVRYAIISVKPGFLKLFGYTTAVYEGQVDQQPPAVYRSQYDVGYARNQFVFERPVAWGFYLIMFFPLFYVLTLRKRSRGKSLPFWALFGLNVFLTFSRAARLAWAFQAAVLLIIDHRKQRKRIVLRLIGVGIIAGGLLYLGRDALLKRDFSDKGHFKRLVEGTQKALEHPRAGRGAGFAGPGSHQTAINTTTQAFNPENQFLQIFLEFGLRGFLFRCCAFGSLAFVGFFQFYQTFRTTAKDKLDNPIHQGVRWLVACSLGIIGIGITGMVLHSFSDRMVVLPSMLVFGLVRGRMIKNTSKTA